MMDITLYIYIVHNKALTSLDIDKYNYIREIALSWPLYLGFDFPCRYFSLFTIGI